MQGMAASAATVPAASGFVKTGENMTDNDQIDPAQDEATDPAEQEQKITASDDGANDDTQDSLEESGKGAAKEKKTPFVPLPELQKERQRRQKLESDFAAHRQQTQAQTELMNQRLAELQQSLMRREEPKVPDLEENPAEHIKHRLGELDTLKQQLAARQQQEIMLMQQQQQEMAIVGQYREKAKEFAEETPDFNDAYQHALAARSQQLKILNPSVPDEMIAQHIRQEEMALVAQAIQTGRNPAQVIYEFARSSGYAPKAKPATAEDKLATLAKGVESSKAVGAIAGSGKATRSLEDVASMTFEEISKISDSDWRRLMGG